MKKSLKKNSFKAYFFLNCKGLFYAEIKKNNSNYCFGILK